MKDTVGHPLAGLNYYGIYSKMKSSQSIVLEFPGDSKLEIKETGILGITLVKTTSDEDSNGNHLAVLEITDDYRNDF